MTNTSFRLEVSVLRPNWSGCGGERLAKEKGREEVGESCKGIFLSLHQVFIQMTDFCY